MENKVLNQLKKILKLANDAGAAPGEVEAAMAKAKLLAMRHQIDISSIDYTGDEKRAGGLEVGTDETLKIKAKYRQPYHKYIALVLREVFGVQLIWISSPSPGGRVVHKITLIGEATDVAIAREIFPYLEKVFPATLSRLVSARTLTYCAAHTNGCYLGLYHGIVEANKREEEGLSADDKSKWAMVLVKKEDLVKQKEQELFPKLKTNKDRTKKMSEYAAMHGHLIGTGINLRQVKAPTSATQIK